MTEDFSYLEERIEPQRKWHSDKAVWFKRRYYMSEIIMLVAAALIAVINVIEIIPETSLRMISASLAALTILMGGLSKLFKYQENWLNFRALAEALKREKEFYIHKVGDYDSESPSRDKILVARVETMLGSVTSQYISTQKSKLKKTRAIPT